MDPDSGGTAHFRLFDSTGFGLAGLDENNVILQVNETFLRYLELEASAIIGQNVAGLADTAASPEFWEHFSGDGSFLALIPGKHHLFLGTALTYSDPAAPAVKRIVLIRPYSLEREFMRMRSRLNQNVAFEISEHLGSLAVAGEIILQPELQDDDTTKQRFLGTFLSDIQDLSSLFNELQDIAEPVPFPNRIRFERVDYQSLLSDMLAKLKGFVAEKNVSVSQAAPDNIPAVEGDHDWLALALYHVFADVIGAAPALGEVKVGCAVSNGVVKTIIEAPRSPESGSTEAWPPQTLYPLAEGQNRLGSLKFSNYSISRCIFLTHGGDLTLQQTEEGDQLTVTLPV